MDKSDDRSEPEPKREEEHLLSGVPDPRTFDNEYARELTLAFKAGSSRAYEEIYRIHRDRAERICLRMLGNRQDAEEALQETFLRVYQGLGHFNGRYQLGAWIARIASNVCLDKLRAAGRRPVEAEPDLFLESRPDEVGQAQQGQPEEAVVRRVEAEQIKGVLEVLPHLHKMAILMRDEEGLSYEEIATRLALSESQVKSLLHRARRNFRRAWMSGVAGVFLPFRLLNRLAHKFRSAQSTIESGAQTVTSSPALTSCSVLIQQCGQLVGERVATLATAATVGVAAVGAGMGATVPPAPQRFVSTEQASISSGSTQRRQPEKGSQEPKGQEADRVEATGTDSTPEPSSSKEQGSKPEPTPVPSSSPTAAPAPGQQGDKSARPPAPVSSHPSLRFDGGAADYPIPGSNVVSLTCDELALSQTLETSINDRDGAQPALLRLSVGAGVGVELTVSKNGYEIRYSGGGSVTRWQQDDRYGSLSFAGRYGTGNPYAHAAKLPKSGSFTASLSVDCETGSVLAESIVFTAD